MDTFEDRLRVFFLCFVLFAVTLYLRMGVAYPAEFVKKIISILSLTEDTLEIFGLSVFVEIIKKYEPWKVLLFLSFSQMIISSLIVLIFKKKSLFAYNAIKNDYTNVIKYGTLCFFTTIIIVLFFLLSVVGIPIAFLILCLFEIFVFFGCIPLSVFIGKHILEYYNIKMNSIVFDYFFGSFLMLLLGSVYYIGSTFIFFVFPCLSLGVFINVIVKYKRYGKYYFKNSEERQSFDKEHLRKIIKGDK